MQTIIIGAVYRYDWRRIASWVRSLKLSRFDGEIHLLNYGVDAATLARLVEAGVEVHPCELRGEQLVVRRFADLAELVTDFDPAAWVVFPDVGDIVFQLDPSVFLRGVTEHSIVCASEGVTFEGNRWTRENLCASFPESYERLRSELLYNAGSIAARAEIFSQLAGEIHAMCRTRPDAQNHDQAAFNILLRGAYREHALLTKATGGWCYCAASSLLAKPSDRAHYQETLPVIRQGKCYVGRGQLTCMFHHYTRSPILKHQVEAWIRGAWRAQRMPA